MMPEELFEKLAPILGPKARKLYIAWMLADKEEKEDLEQYLKMLYVKHLEPMPGATKVLLTPPPSNLCTGAIPVGMVLYNGQPLHEFCLRESELAQHIAVFGRTGSGKTNTVRFLLKGFARQRKPFLIFDWKKDYSQMDFDEVFAGTGIRDQDILVLPVGKLSHACLKLNPLIPPPSTSPDIWVKQLCEILTHAYMGGPGFESIFLKAIDHCYEARGIYQGGKDYPTFNDVKEYLKCNKFSGREAMWMQSVMRTINSICYGGMSSTVNAEQPHDIATLLGKNIILELDALGNTDKTFLVEAIMLYLHHYRLGNPPMTRVDNILVIEEAHHLLRKSEGEESIIESSLREMRSLGIGIVIVDQMPSLISKVAMANTYCTIALNVKTGQDVSALSQAMLLGTEQKQMLGMLPVGEAIIKLQDRYIKPFQVRVPLVYASRRVLHYRPPEGLAGVSRIPMDSSKTARVPPRAAGLPAQISTSSSVEDGVECAPVQGDQGRAEDRLLIDITSHLTDSVTARYKRLGLSARKGNHCKQKLVKAGLIKPVTFAGHGAWLRLFEITREGIARLKTLGRQGPSARGGGLEHRYWQEKLAEHFRSRGYQVEVEKPIKHHIVDIIASNKKECVAVEVETGKSSYKKNITECLKSKKLTTVLVACVSADVADSIRKEMDSCRDERLWIDDVKTIVSSNPY